MSSSQFLFAIKRLVVVDSAGFCYVELPVHEHALLLGSGNLGKSSVLNALRLFLLPENSFKASRRKFGFRNAKLNQYYTNEESFQHYFPGSRSFLIMEVSNPAGTHCQILHRAENLGYGRIFVPVAYDQLRPLFWHASDDPDAIGSAVPELSLSSLSDRLKTLSRDVVFTRDTGKLRNLMYASELMSGDAIRYSVLPLADADERKVESLRTLILLLFEMSADDRAMAEAVAGIIEADKKFASDALDLDIDQFLQRHEELKEENARLTALEGEVPRFNRLQQAFKEYREKAHAQGAFAAFREGLAKALDEAREQRQLIGRQVQLQDDRVKGLKADIRKLESRYSEQSGVIKQQRSELKKFTEIRQNGQTLLARYPGVALEEIQEILREELRNEEEQLRALQNDAAAEEQRKRLTQGISEKDAELTRIQQRINARQWQLHRQLPFELAAPLAAVEPRLIHASPGQALSADTLETIGAFVRLFDQSQEGYRWFDETFQRQEITDDKLEEDRERAQAERRQLQQRLDELTQVESEAFNRPQRIEKLKKEINSIRQDLALLENLPAADGIIKRAEAAVQSAMDTQAAIDKKLERLSTQQDEACTELAKIGSERAQVDSRQGELSGLRDRVNGLERRIRHLEQASPDQPLSLDQVTKNALDAIEADLDTLESLRGSILGQLQQFAFQGLLDEQADGLQLDSPPAGVIKDAYSALEAVFAELPGRRQILQEQVAAHNESVSSYRQALRINKEHIERFQSQLNRELDGVTINDLAEVRVDIHCHQKFRNLVEESEALDPYSTELLSDAFYERLQVFVAEFFGDQDGPGAQHRLTMDKIVTGITYRTRKQTEASLETKGQSTSTTVLINLELVQRLLRRVLSPGVRLSFPLVLDEFASVDVSQIPSLLERLKAQGFNLFAAATHSASTELIHQVGRHFELGQMHTQQPYDKHRTLVLWGGPEGFTSTDSYSDWLTAEQTDLLEGSHG